MAVSAGQACYEAYRETMERKYAPGLSLPLWTGLDRVMRLAYEAAAAAVISQDRRNREEGDVEWQ